MKPEKTQFFQGSVRTFSDWTPYRVRSAVNQMMLGSYHEAGVLIDSILGDDRLQSVLGTRVNGILALPIKFEPADDSKAALSVAASLADDFWNIFPEDDIAELMRYGLMAGASVAQIIWERKGNQLLPSLETWHPSLQRYDQWQRQWYVYTDKGEIEINPADGQWVIFRPGGKQRPWTNALLRALALPWLSKIYAVTDWNRHSENLGSGVKKGTHPTAADEGAKSDFRAQLFGLANSGVVLLPEGWDIELLFAEHSVHGAFEQLIALANTSISIAVLGQNLSTEVNGGSFAAAQVHEQVRGDLIRADTQLLSTTLHNQVLGYWASYNYGDNVTPYPLWQTDPPEDEKLQAETDDKRFGAFARALNIAKHYKLPIDIAALALRYNIPLREGQPIPTDFKDAQDLSLPPTIRLASGDDTSGNHGFINGQLYTDALGDYAQDYARIVTLKRAEDIKQLIQDVANLDNPYEALREGLLKYYDNLSPDNFAEVMQNALVLGNLAGRYAVAEDM